MPGAVYTACLSYGEPEGRTQCRPTRHRFRTTPTTCLLHSKCGAGSDRDGRGVCAAGRGCHRPRQRHRAPGPERAAADGPWPAGRGGTRNGGRRGGGSAPEARREEAAALTAGSRQTGRRRESAARVAGLRRGEVQELAPGRPVACRCAPAAEAAVLGLADLIGCCSDLRFPAGSLRTGISNVLGSNVSPHLFTTTRVGKGQFWKKTYMFGFGVLPTTW